MTKFLAIVKLIDKYFITFKKYNANVYFSLKIVMVMKNVIIK